MTNTTYVSITDFGAVGDGQTDNRAAIQKAVDYAKANGKDVYVPAGTFVHKGLVVLDGVGMYGAGSKAVLKAVGDGKQSVELTGDGAVLKNVTLDSSSTDRGHLNTDAKILVDHAGHFTVEGVAVVNSHSAGMMIYASHDGAIQHNSLSGTNADSIHMTGGSHDILVQNNRIDHAGDDGIAVVSYGTANLAHDITINNNVVLDSNWGRNISVVGGERIAITGNYVDGNGAGLAGIYLATEPAYHSGGVHATVVAGNVVKDTGGSKTGHGNIMLYDGTSETLDGVSIFKNILEGQGVHSSGSGIHADIHDNTVGHAPGLPEVAAGADYGL
jgi:polygalacturonase